MQKLLNTSTLFLQPHFASGFVFELRVDTNKNYYVRVLNKTNKYPEPDALNPVQIYGIFNYILTIEKKSLLNN